MLRRDSKPRQSGALLKTPKVILAIQHAPLGKAAIAPILGHKSVSGELHKQIRRLVDLDFIERTISEKSTSRLQEYRLTEKGNALLDD